MTHTIAVTDAQLSAIECRPNDMPARIRGRTLRFEDAPALATWLNEASNAEDGQHMQTGCQYARRAAVSLACLYGKVLKVSG